MKTAIVTGANGFVGHHLVNELSQNEYFVIAIVRSKESNIDNINQIANVKIVYSDMSNISEMEEELKIFEPEILFHLAWEGSSGEKRADYEIQLNNAKYTLDVARVAKNLGCAKMVVAGSVTQLMYRDYLRLDEISPELITCYAMGKCVAEAMLKSLCASLQLEYCWAYISNFYGVDDPTGNFVNFLIQNYRKKITPCLTPATQLADFMHVTDVARGLRIMGEQGKGNTSYYLGYGSPKPLSYFIDVIHRKVAPEIDNGIGRKEFFGLDIDFERIDYTKFARETMFEPQISFEDGVEQILKNMSGEDEK